MDKQQILDILFTFANFAMTKLVYIIPSIILLGPSLIAFIKSSISLIKRLKDFDETEATIVEFYDSISTNNRNSRSYFPILSYEINNKTYIHKYTLGIKNKKIGDKIKIFYNTQNPEEIRFKFLTFFNPIISLMCLSFSILFSIMMISEMP